MSALMNANGLLPNRGRLIPFSLTKYQALSHQWRIGSSGTGKSNLGMQDLLRQRRAGGPAVVLDLECEYIRKLYRTGDTVICAADERTVFWDLRKEHDGDILTCGPLARNLLDRNSGESNNKNAIFHKWASNVLAGLLALKNPTTEELSGYISNMDSLQDALKNTAYAAMIPQHGNDQRAGVEGMLSCLAEPLSLLPRTPKGRKKFSIREYMRQPKGFIWFLGRSDILSSLLPLYTGQMSLFLHHGMSGLCPGGVLFFYDETHLMGYIESLPTAYTNMRKRGNMVIAGFQNPSQGEETYGKEQWNTMWSQAGTHWIFATPGRSAKELSEMFGEYVALRAEHTQSQSDGLFQPNRGSSRCTVQKEPLVPTDWIAGGSNLDAFLWQRGFQDGRVKRGKIVAVPVTVPPLKDTLPDIAPAFLPRKMDPIYVYEKVTEQQAAPASGEELGPPLAEEYARYEAAQAAATSPAKPSPQGKKRPSKAEPPESSKSSETQKHNQRVFAALEGEPLSRFVIKETPRPQPKPGVSPDDAQARERNRFEE